MTCHEYHSRLSSYMDGELSRWRRWKIENHLRRCNECAAVLRELEEADQALAQSLLGEPAPSYLTDAVMFRIPAMPPARRRPGGMLPWAAGLAVAGMQAMVLLGAYWSGFAHGSSTAPHPSTAGFGTPGLIGGNVPSAGFARTSPTARVTPVNNEPRGFTAMPFGRPLGNSTALTQPVSQEEPSESARLDRRAAKRRINTSIQFQGVH
jgi:anti-sigma factor RsiW